MQKTVPKVRSTTHKKGNTRIFPATLQLSKKYLAERDRSDEFDENNNGDDGDHMSNLLDNDNDDFSVEVDDFGRNDNDFGGNDNEDGRNKNDDGQKDNDICWGAKEQSSGNVNGTQLYETPGRISAIDASGRPRER